ncbi:unnamed protein product [Polarella glacialis]|uniref:Endonuclease/exonuclease/phosphatase domain-containing protein n=2 Tax=Polarella glacialis TaxID=89957 RepID=A0A813FIT1_POLGL|nr:unnamed protein product [Polarella glacialis]
MVSRRPVRPDATGAGVRSLAALLEFEEPDVTHKLQEANIPEVEPVLLDIFDRALPSAAPHRATWAVSTARKGYSGTCAIYSPSAGGGVERTAVGEVDTVDREEGRTVRLDLLCGLSVIGAYVPNSGASLQRLTYRVDGWDESLRRHLEKLDGQNAVLLCGDLNAAHEDSDIWNPEDSRMPRQAGTTPEERASFAKTLHELGFVDAWRWQHPNAKGVYSASLVLNIKVLDHVLGPCHGQRSLPDLVSPAFALSGRCRCH